MTYYIFFLLCPSSLAEVTCQLNGYSCINVIPRFEAALSTTDSLCYIGLFYINSLTTVVAAYLFKDGDIHVNNLLASFKRLDNIHLDPKKIKQLRCQNILRTTVIVMLNTVFAGVLAYPGVQLTMGQDPTDSMGEAALYIIWFLGDLLCYYSPVLITVNLTAHQHLKMLHAYQEKYVEVLVAKYGTSPQTSHIKPNQITTVQGTHEVTKVLDTSLEEDLRQGLELFDVIRLNNFGFGRFFLVECTISLMTQTTSAFLCFLLPQAFQSGPFQVIPFCLGLSMFLLLIVSVVRYFGMMQLGQNLMQGNMDIQYHLQNILANRFRIMSEEEKNLVGIVLDRASNVAPLCPNQIFPMNYSTGLSAMGVCFTYLVVLLQFRSGESGGDSLDIVTVA